MISYDWYSIKPTFDSASTLKSALLASFVQADIDYGGSGKRPIIMYPDGREWSAAPAWGWTKFLLQTRSDWWPSLGIAIQHAVKENDAYGRLALNDILREGEFDWPALGILEWIVPLAEGHDDDLAKRIAELEVSWDKREEEGIASDEEGKKVNTEADVDPQLRLSALRGWTFELWGDILGTPWDWLYFYSYVHRWLLPAAPKACAAFASQATERETWALIDYLLQSRDAWRHADLLAAWAANHPSWWDNAAEVMGPKGPHKPKEWERFDTLGGMASTAHGIALAQLATPPVLDLEPLY